VGPSTPPPELARMRDATEAEAVALLRAMLDARPNLANIDIYARVTLENPRATWVQDGLRVTLSANRARTLRWEAAPPAEQLAGAETWWWITIFENVGAASEKLYAEKNAPYGRSKG